VSITLLPLYSQGNSSRYPFSKSLDGPQIQSVRYGDFLPLLGIESRLLCFPAHSLVVTLTELSLPFAILNSIHMGMFRNLELLQLITIADYIKYS
jgi:hypothetical protein